MISWLRAAAFATLVSACCGFSSFWLAAKADSQDPTLFEAAVEIETTNRFDWSGSILEARGPGGRVFGLGFNETFTTYRHHNDAVLHAFVMDGGNTLEAIEIGKPAGWLIGHFQSAPARLLLANPALSWRSAGLSGARWRLIDQETRAAAVLARFGLDVRQLGEDCGFVMVERVTHALLGNCIATQGRHISLHALRAQLAFGEGRLRPVFLGRGVLVLHRQDVSGITVGIVACNMTARLQIQTCATEVTRGRDEFAYAVGPTDAGIVVALNSGRLLVFDPVSVRFRVSESDGFSLQLYAFARYGERGLWGQYPDGQVGEVRDGRFESSVEQPLSGLDSANSLPELQTLGIYKGWLWAGIWPYGTVHRASIEEPNWLSFRRMFSGPEIKPGESEPFAAALGNNAMGQRITDMLPFGDSLYVATGSKTGILPQLPSAPDAEGIRSLLPEYGRVWRIRGTGALAIPLMEFQSANRTGITIRITRSKLQIITAAGASETMLAGPPRGCIQELLHGRGTYGEARNLNLKVTIRTNRLACK